MSLILCKIHLACIFFLIKLNWREAEKLTFLLDALSTGSHKIRSKQIGHCAEVSQKDVVNHQDVIRKGWQSRIRLLAT